MKINVFHKIILFIAVDFILIGCTGSNNSNQTPTISPYPYPQTLPYESPPIFNLPNYQVSNGQVQNILNYTGNNLGIAYSASADPGIADLSGLVKIYSNGSTYICTATPILYNQQTNQTVFVTAAHCFMSHKSNSNTVVSSDVSPVNGIGVFYGLSPDTRTTINYYQASAVYLPLNYCSGATFNQGYDCPLFYYIPNTQQNDIAVLVVNGGPFGNPNNYAKLIQLSNYPQVYTGAPILSIGFGAVNNAQESPILINGIPKAFDVTNYFYMVDDNPGYHHVYNSYFNSSQNGYTTLICNGDSGGPDLYWDGTNQNWDLISEHSFGPAGVCGGFIADLHNGNVATRVGDYYDWIMGIESNINNQAYCSESVNNCLMVTA